MIMIIIIIIIIITKVFPLPGRIYFFKNSNFHRFVKTILTDQQTILTARFAQKHIRTICKMMQNLKNFSSA